MAYQLRFESNAFQADSAIGRLLDGLSALSKGARRAVGIQVKEYEGNELRQLRGINQRTFQRAMDWADNDFDQQMASEEWRWNQNQTRRKNGQLVGSPRDIIDTGDLLQSKERVQVNRSTVDFIWKDDVAELVHDGGTTKNGGAYPARPWTEPTVDELDNVIDTVFRKGGF
jgi:hypothetical protein